MHKYSYHCYHHHPLFVALSTPYLILSWEYCATCRKLTSFSSSVLSVSSPVLLFSCSHVLLFSCPPVLLFSCPPVYLNMKFSSYMDEMSHFVAILKQGVSPISPNCDQSLGISSVPSPLPKQEIYPFSPLKSEDSSPCYCIQCSGFAAHVTNGQTRAVIG